ncbi:MAG: hypothetical protein P4L84_33590 [Isosphaeraceae bacterium]|nr:hypothetical protein [Isosphaeraceae bacterium]
MAIEERQGGIAGTIAKARVRDLTARPSLPIEHSVPELPAVKQSTSNRLKLLYSVGVIRANPLDCVPGLSPGDPE